MSLAPQVASGPPADGTSISTVSTRAGLLPLGELTQKDFDAGLAKLKTSLARLATIKSTLMEPGVDYGVIPGTKQPTLLQPGAQKLCFVARLAASFVVQRSVGMDDLEPDVHYLVTCRLHLNDTAGPVIGEGVGSANNYERKYRYRRGQRVCPECQKDTVMRSKFPDKETGEKGWYCNPKRDGCAAQFTADDPRIVEQEQGEVENADPHDLDNTLLKMAKKRAFVDATLLCTASSGDFTQDLEDTAGAAKAADAAKQNEDRNGLLGRIGNILRARNITTQSGLNDLTMITLGLSQPTDPRTLDNARLVELVTKLEGQPQSQPTAQPVESGANVVS